jgi:hypothetical protein
LSIPNLRARPYHGLHVRSRAQAPPPADPPPPGVPRLALALSGGGARGIAHIGVLRAVGRVGAGNVFERARDVALGGLRWGASAGLYHPSPVGPVALEIGVREGGATLTALSVGWN